MKTLFFCLLLALPTLTFANNNCCAIDTLVLDPAFALDSVSVLDSSSPINPSLVDDEIYYLHEQSNTLQNITPESQAFLPDGITADYKSNKQSISENHGNVTINEVDVGFRKQWDISNISPYIGGGVAAASVTAENSQQPQSLASEFYNMGNFYQAGANFHINPNWSFGVHLEYNNTKLEYAGENLKQRELNAAVSTIFRW